MSSVVTGQICMCSNYIKICLSKFYLRETHHIACLKRLFKKKKIRRTSLVPVSPNEYHSKIYSCLEKVVSLHFFQLKIDSFLVQYIQTDQNSSSFPSSLIPWHTYPLREIYTPHVSPSERNRTLRDNSQT